MIINQPGAEFFFEDVCYKIGDRIVGTDASEYQGLLGSIIEIRDGEDKETENETPDIYSSAPKRSKDSIAATVQTSKWNVL